MRNQRWIAARTNACSACDQLNSSDYENASQHLINNTKKHHARYNCTSEALCNLDRLDEIKWEGNERTRF